MCYNNINKAREDILMKTIIIIVRNITTTETYIYTREELTKARIAVDYLTTTTPYLWYIERKMVEA